MPLDRAMKASGTPDSQLLRVSEVADYLGVSCRVVYEWLTSGVIPSELVVRAGRAIYIKRQALDVWLLGRNGTQPPAPT
jgi:excisionase family DNA binding protein